MAVIAVIGRKGGIGKTTLAANLAGEFAAIGWEVAIVDADPQHSLLAWARQGGGLLSQCVHSVASPEELRPKVRELSKHAGRVLIDTPPGNRDMLHQAALTADLALLPCGPSPLDLFAVKDALSWVLKARALRKAKKPRIRLVPSRVTYTNLGRSLPESLAKLGKKVLPGVTQRVALAECVEAGMTIREFAPASPAHMEFDHLAKTIDRLLAKDRSK
jgi:chromosome partitioning protein